LQTLADLACKRTHIYLTEQARKPEVDPKITYAMHKAYKTAANYLKVEQPLKQKGDSWEKMAQEQLR